MVAQACLDVFVLGESRPGEPPWDAIQREPGSSGRKQDVRGEIGSALLARLTSNQLTWNATLHCKGIWVAINIEL